MRQEKPKIELEGKCIVCGCGCRDIYVRGFKLSDAPVRVLAFVACPLHAKDNNALVDAIIKNKLQENQVEIGGLAVRHCAIVNS